MTTYVLYRNFVTGPIPGISVTTRLLPTALLTAYSRRLSLSRVALTVSKQCYHFVRLGARAIEVGNVIRRKARKLMASNMLQSIETFSVDAAPCMLWSMPHLNL